MVLNSIRTIRMKYKNHDEIVIACDSRRSWRKAVFPYYKANRAKNRAKSELDWQLIFDSFAVIISELKEFFPYRVIQVDTAEADDVIGALVQEFASEVIMGFNKTEIVIVSGDKDFKQLQRYENITQWDHVHKKLITCNDADKYLYEHIIRGDAGDGIPNVLSDDDTFVVEGKRQKQLRETKMESFMQAYPSIHDDISKRNWKRNEQLIDLRHTPDELRAQILEQYQAEAGKTRAKLINYFIAKGLKNLHENINQF